MCSVLTICLILNLRLSFACMYIGRYSEIANNESCGQVVFD